MVAHRLALELGGEIVSCDSVQLYRRFDIGAAKPSREEQAQVPHHMIDILDWSDLYDARHYANDAYRAIDDILNRKKIPVIVGGTGLYLRALWGVEWDDLPSDPSLRAELESLTNEQLAESLQAIDPARAQKIHVNDRYRLLRAVELIRLLGKPISEVSGQRDQKPFGHVIRIFPPRALAHEAIAERTKRMLDDGFIEEVRGLLTKGCPVEAKPMQSIGYKQVCQWLESQMKNRKVLEESIVAATRQYAKRQYTWFKQVAANHNVSDPRTEWNEILDQAKLYLREF